MTEAEFSATILSVSESITKDGQLICKGKVRFTSAKETANRKEVTDEMDYRCKGAPAVEVKESGIGGTGVGIGYLDQKLVEYDGYKEMEVCLVIRNWHKTSIMMPTVFDSVEAQLQQATDNTISVGSTEEVSSSNPEDAPRPAETFAF